MKTLLAVLIMAFAIAVGRAQTNLSTGATNTVAPILTVSNASAVTNAATPHASDGQNNILTTIIVAVLTAIPASILSFVFALRQFRTQKWWELKAEAYSRIVESLYNAMEYCSDRSDAYLFGHNLSEERQKELNEAYAKAYREIRKATGTGAFIISDEAAKVLEVLENRERLEPDGPKAASWYEIYDADAEAYKTALTKIRMLAKEDLRVR
jgi:hypothetical protein